MQAHRCQLLRQIHSGTRPARPVARHVCRASVAPTSVPRSRRQALQEAVSCALLSSIGSELLVAKLAHAEETASEVPVPDTVASAASPSSSRQVYLDVKIEGKPAGRIVVELFPDVPVGTQRFADLAVGMQGVAYRLSKFDGIFDSYIRNEGVKQLSYAADGASPVAGGDSTQQLEEEMAASSARRHTAAGLVSLVVKEATERPVKERLVAMRGKLVTIKEQAGEAPNGSAFSITTGPAPELDATNLVVGQVVAGQEVIDAIRALPVNKPPKDLYNKPFFEVGKAIGDKRATVAEKGFNRPLKRALIASAGVV